MVALFTAAVLVLIRAFAFSVVSRHFPLYILSISSSSQPFKAQASPLGSIETIGEPLLHPQHRPYHAGKKATNLCRPRKGLNEELAFQQQ